MSNFVAAAVQWYPVVHDASAGADRACDAVREAAKSGAQVVVFPELWLQGYPYWAANQVRTDSFQACRAKLFNEAIEIGGPEIAKIAKAAAKHKCIVVMSAHEKSGGTVYNSQIFINDDGKILGSHRKLVPTQTERLVHGRGDGSGLTVYDTAIGRIGGLQCYEHQMAPARYALCELGEQLHAAAWPGHAFLDPVIDASTRHLAFENGTFVVVARELMNPEHIAASMPEDTGDAQFWHAHGGSAIISPTGEYLAGPVFDEETIICADIDYEQISFAKWWVDGTGHYARPDVFQLQWDRRPKPPVKIID